MQMFCTSSTKLNMTSGTFLAMAIHGKVKLSCTYTLSSWVKFEILIIMIIALQCTYNTNIVYNAFNVNWFENKLIHEYGKNVWFEGHQIHYKFCFHILLHQEINVKYTSINVHNLKIYWLKFSIYQLYKHCH